MAAASQRAALLPTASRPHSLLQARNAATATINSNDRRHTVMRIRFIPDRSLPDLSSPEACFPGEAVSPKFNFGICDMRDQQ